MSGRESLSKTPSWMMVGFVIGAVVTWTVKTHWDNQERFAQAMSERIEKANPAPAPTPLPAPPGRASLTDLEAVFQRWETHANWRNDVTEVAFWDPATAQFSEYVEILRNGDDYYFRAIPRLTRPFADEELPREAPLRFTDPESNHSDRRLRLTPSNP